MININALGKQFGPQILFENVTLQLNPGERYGLVGANGAGKSTFLKMLIGDEGADSGQITFGRQLKLGVLRQDQFLDDAETTVSVAMKGDVAVFEALAEVDRLSHSADPDAHRIAELNDIIAHNDGYTLEARARETLTGLGIVPDKHDQPLGILSGGYKLRALLAQVLVGRPDVLLLDEPTNHLDILSIRWLEQFLRSYAGCAVIISHDRRFLDGVTTRILDVDYQTILDYPGNYTEFLARKELERLQRDAEIERSERKIAEMQAFVDRFKAKATKARQAQSRAKQIEKIEVKEAVRSSRRAPLFSFPQERPTGRDVLTVEHVTKGYDGKPVLKNVSFNVRRGEKVAVIGANGIGKSTLLKILTSQIEADAGSFAWGLHANLGYFAQDHHDLLNDPRMTPLSFVWDRVPQEETSYVRGQLGRMLFSGDDVEKKVTTLSGGEAARVIFAAIAVKKPNILVLDEPTNHLDLEAIEGLAACLASYEGTLLFVSHDRWFVSQIADRIIELKEDGLHDFPGTYEEYLERSGDDHLSHEKVVLKAKTEKAAKDKPEPETSAASAAAAPVAPQEELSYEERKRRANRLKSLPKKRDAVMAQIEELEAEKASILERYAEPGFFTETPEADQKALHYREAEVSAKVDELMQEWEELEAEIAELSE